MIAKEYGTPFLLYDEKGLVDCAESLFSWCSAIAKPELYLPMRYCMPPVPLDALLRLGVGVRCETSRELQAALDAGVPGDKIRYAARWLPKGLAAQLRELDAILLLLLPTARPDIVPRRVELAIRAADFRTTPLLPACAKYGDGFSFSTLCEIAPELSGKGAETLGLLLPFDGNAPATTFMPTAAETLMRAARMLWENCGLDVPHIDLGGALGLNYHHFNLPFDAYTAVRDTCAVIASADRAFTVSLSPWRQMLETNGVYVATILETCEGRAKTLVTDADPLLLDAPRRDRFRHAEIAGHEDGWELCSFVGLRGDAGGRVMENCWLQRPRKGDFVMLRDMGCSARGESGTRVLTLCADGSIRAS